MLKSKIRYHEYIEDLSQETRDIVKNFFSVDTATQDFLKLKK